MGTRTKGQGVVPARVWTRGALDRGEQGGWSPSFTDRGPCWSGCEGVLGHLLPLTHNPSVARPSILVAAPAQLRQIRQFLDSNDAVVE